MSIKDNGYTFSKLTGHLSQSAYVMSLHGSLAEIRNWLEEALEELNEYEDIV